MSNYQPVAAIAWGEPCVTHLDGKSGLVFVVPFELIPGGSMANARVAKHGFVYIDTYEIPENRQHDPDALLQVRIEDPASVLTAENTTVSELEPYVDQIVDGFRLHLNAQVTSANL